MNTNNLNVSGTTKLNGSTTCMSSLNISGVTTLSGNTYNSGSIGINTSSPLSRLTIRMSYSDGNTGGLCIDSSDPNIYNLKVFHMYKQVHKLDIIFTLII